MPGGAHCPTRRAHVHEEFLRKTCLGVHGGQARRLGGLQLETGNTFIAGTEPNSADLDSARGLDPNDICTHTWLFVTAGGSPVLSPSAGADLSLLPGPPHSRSRPPPGLASMTRIVFCTSAPRISKSAIDFQTANKNVFIRWA